MSYIFLFSSHYRICKYAGLLCPFRLHPPPLLIPTDINLVKLSRKFNQLISKNETRKTAVIHFTFQFSLSDL